MTRYLVAFAAILALSSPLSAQNNTFGVTFGTAEFLEDSISLDFELDVQEIWYSRGLDDHGTEFRFKLGQADVQVEEEESNLALGEYEVEYALGLVEYRFHEVYGSTTIFLGPGAYQIQSEAGEQTEFGVSAGVAGDFPITRRLGFVLEGAYHWVNYDEDFEFLTLGAGIRVAF